MKEFVGNDVQPIAPVLQRNGGGINQGIADVPLEIEAV